MPIGWEWDETLFLGSAPFYERGRLPYAPGLAEAFGTALDLDGHGRLIDVGCGPGIVTLTLAPLFATVIGVDPDPGMLAEAPAAPPPPASPTSPGTRLWPRICRAASAPSRPSMSPRSPSRSTGWTVPASPRSSPDARFRRGLRQVPTSKGRSTSPAAPFRILLLPTTPSKSSSGPTSAPFAGLDKDPCPTVPRARRRTSSATPATIRPSAFASPPVRLWSAPWTTSSPGPGPSPAPPLTSSPNAAPPSRRPAPHAGRRRRRRPLLRATPGHRHHHLALSRPDLIARGRSAGSKEGRQLTVPGTQCDKNPNPSYRCIAANSTMPSSSL